MIRVVVVDDHPALRAGLHTVLESEPGIVYAGESDGGEESLWPLLRRVEPGRRAARLPPAQGRRAAALLPHQAADPGARVIIFSAYASPDLLLAAQLAKADAVLNKGVGARELFETIRARRGGRAARRRAVGGAAARGASRTSPKRTAR